MVLVNMRLEVFTAFTEVSSGHTADKAVISLVNLSLVVLVSHLTESVDYDTEHNIHKDDINLHVEAHIENQPSLEIFIFLVNNVHIVTHTTSCPHTIGQSIKEATVQGLAIDVIVPPVRVLEGSHDPNGKHKDTESHKKQCCKQLIQMCRYGCYNVSCSSTDIVQ